MGNAGLTFEQIDHPQNLLRRWLGFRLEPGQKIETFSSETCRLHPDTPGFIVDGYLLPNPLCYARDAKSGVFDTTGRSGRRSAVQRPEHQQYPGEVFAR